MIFSDIVISPDGLRSLGCTAFPGCTVPLWLERTEDKLGFLHHRPHSVVPRGRMRSIRQGPNYSVITGLHSLPEWRGVFRGAGIIQTKHCFHCFGLELRVSLPRPLSDSLVLESCTLSPSVLYSECRTSGYRECHSKPGKGPCHHQFSPRTLES